MSEKTDLIRDMIARAREVAEERGVCDEAEIIIDQMEAEFLDHFHPAKDRAQEHTNQFTEDQVSNWDAEDVTRRLRQAFMAGWDAREGIGIEDPRCMHESYTESASGWRVCNECGHGWRAKPE